MFKSGNKNIYLIFQMLFHINFKFKCVSVQFIIQKKWSECVVQENTVNCIGEIRLDLLKAS